MGSIGSHADSQALASGASLHHVTWHDASLKRDMIVVMSMMVRSLTMLSTLTCSACSCSSWCSLSFFFLRASNARSFLLAVIRSRATLTCWSMRCSSCNGNGDCQCQALAALGARGRSTCNSTSLQRVLSNKDGL